MHRSARAAQPAAERGLHLMKAAENIAPAPAATRVELRIDRLSIDAPAGVRPERLQAEVERCLHAGITARLERGGLPPSPSSANSTAARRREPPAQIRATRDLDAYAQRIADAVLGRIWP